MTENQEIKSCVYCGAKDLASLNSPGSGNTVCARCFGLGFSILVGLSAVGKETPIKFDKEYEPGYIIDVIANNEVVKQIKQIINKRFNAEMNVKW